MFFLCFFIGLTNVVKNCNVFSFRLRFFPNFVSPTRCDEIFAELFNEVPWIQRHDIHSGQKAMQPRLTAWYGDVAYRYAGVTVEANSDVSADFLYTFNVKFHFKDDYCTYLKKYQQQFSSLKCLYMCSPAYQLLLKTLNCPLF